MSSEELVSDEAVERALKAGVARMLSRSDPDFDDAVQNGWMVLLRLENIRAPVSAAFHVGRSAAIDVLRRRQRCPCRVDLDAVPAALGRCPPVSSPFVRERLEEAVRSLPPGQRRIFIRTAMLGYSPADLARQSGVHPGSVRSQAWKARRHLQDALRALEPDGGMGGGIGGRVGGRTLEGAAGSAQG